MKKPMTPEELFDKIKSVLEKRTCCRIFWIMGAAPFLPVLQTESAVAVLKRLLAGLQTARFGQKM